MATLKELEDLEVKLFDAYEATMEKTVLRSDKLIDSALRQFTFDIIDSDKPFDEIFNDLVVNSSLSEDLAINIRSSLLQQTAIGYGAVPTLNTSLIDENATVQSLIDVFGKTNGNELSSDIYKSIDSTRESIYDSLKISHKNKIGFNNTVKNIQTDLDKLVFKEENVSRYMRQLEKQGKNLISGGTATDLKQFESSVNKALKQVDNLSDSRALRKTQKKAINDIVKAVQTNTLATLEKAVNNAVKAKYKSNMQRLVITENTAVFEQSAYNERRDNPLVTAVKFNLASSHRVVDECDIIARTDGYGLGAGVFPIQHQPRFPIHPNGVSFMTSVTKSDISEDKARSAGQYRPEQYVKNGKKAGLSNSKLKVLETLPEQPKVVIDSDKAIELTSK